MAADKASKWWIAYAVVVLLGGPYAIFFTSWGPNAYEAICLLLFIYGLGAMVYSLLRPLFHHLRARPAQTAQKPKISEVEVQPVVKTPLLHDDSSRLGRSGIGMPTALNFSVKKTVFLIFLFTSAGCLVHYLSARASRGETLLGLGFMSAVVFYLWLLVEFAESVYRWLKRHTAHSGLSNINEVEGR